MSRWTTASRWIREGGPSCTGDGVDGVVPRRFDGMNSTAPPGSRHVLEHMMVQRAHTTGCRRANSPGASRAAAARENAFTSRDYTAYFQQMQNDRLELSNAARRPTALAQSRPISDELFAKEVQVVDGRTPAAHDDQAQSVVYERLMATAYQTHPYRRPIIGWRAICRT